MIAHVGGVPVEETLLPFLSWAAVGLLVARALVSSRLRRGRRHSATDTRGGRKGGGR